MSHNVKCDFTGLAAKRLACLCEQGYAVAGVLLCKRGEAGTRLAVSVARNGKVCWHDAVEVAGPPRGVDFPGGGAGFPAVADAGGGAGPARTARGGVS